MSRRGPLDVLVVGAGVVGAAAALAFARDGLEVALVESREPPHWREDAPDLRVYAFAPDNAALLDGLGVWKGVTDARAQPYRAMRVWDAAGGGELSFEADAFGRRELGWIVEHGLLVDRLWAALPAAGVRLYCPEQVTGLEQAPDGDSAELLLAGGTRLRARLVLAADGAESQLRSLAGIEAPAHDYGQRGLVAFVDHELPHQATCWQRFLPTGPLAFLPYAGHGGRRSSIVWTLPDAQAERLLQVEDAEFLRELGHAFGGRLGAATAVSRRVAFPLRRQLAQKYVSGRVAIAGDAAHVVHPLAGQGVNLGLRDVAALRKVLADAQRRGADLGGTSRLQRWERERRSENALAAYGFDGLNRLFSNDAVAATLLRGPLLGLAGKLPPVTHAFWRRAAGV
ncbi:MULTISPECIES: FAD-dependent oxidoreductase [unclassified Lysobacter]|uniref:FAD-dependent oxidoreductase n=1 Tax=unclassified Lysobacter TaxID=2635362 RepID=UPI0006FE75CB|nr:MULTISPECIES: FAD-dependent oxidoreductase [unclassified Lysobacter]KQZ66638.1 2-octaprenyl-3-methyl-6-methoxy-1,4-benzoquinol hydroxylase [Lysobacter sp. Root559]KRA71983.1 2-octaprenyl-3-methyl-6-methoxy-1,4-benzoquinol hydroxylase [Lysobacter sp. Root667]KRC32790.1 2-octaprenyl-3-methyl-6-methoxy-1,4-benzoquinol hydroxylase [Lysobacter sp. Root76]KRD67867.1 2-octaprenyl-3-methyl-6-methoxy-1,4-benzoquinol hydroxylase [Lysobacter sp. Root96]